MRSGRKSSHLLQLLRQGPDRGAALAQYEARAATYDFELALFEPIRGRAIERLKLQLGETVLDVGCGTGLSLERLQREVGATGHVVGIEQCPAMIVQARTRIGVQANENVTLICAPAEESQLEGSADAALFHFTHDVLRRPAALDRVLRHLKPGGRLVACGLQWASPWALPINLFVWGAALRSVCPCAASRGRGPLGRACRWPRSRGPTSGCGVSPTAFAQRRLWETSQRRLTMPNKPDIPTAQSSSPTEYLGTSARAGNASAPRKRTNSPPRAQALGGLVLQTLNG